MQPDSTNDARARKGRPRIATAERAWGDAVPTVSEAADLKRASILRAAAQCFNRSGFHGTSMNDIAKRLGVTKAALYRYVRNKDELLYESFNIAMDSSIASLDRAESTGRNGLDKVRIALRLYLSDLIGKLGHPVVLLEENALGPRQSRAIIARRDEAEKRYRAFVEEGMQDGSVIQCNSKLAVFALLGAINWVPKWYRPEGDWSVELIVESLVDIITRSIAAHA
jgi:TetR/AcrR family transcriptional regulator